MSFERAKISPLSFVFAPENMKEIQNILSRYPTERKASAVMPLLTLAQKQNNGYLSPACITEVAKILEMPEIRAFEVASFYSMYNLHPVGKHVVEVCTTTPCALRGAEKILRVCKKYLDLDVGQTTHDGLFTLREVECLGACSNAPMVQIGDHYYEDLDESSICQVLDLLRDNKSPTPGSQTGRRASEPDPRYLEGDDDA